MYPNTSVSLQTPLLRIYSSIHSPYFYFTEDCSIVFPRFYQVAMAMASSWLTLKTCSNLNAKAPLFKGSFAHDPSYPSYISSKIRYAIRYSTTFSSFLDYKILILDFIYLMLFGLFVKSLGRSGI